MSGLICKIPWKTQQNGIAKRRNLTLMDMVKSMMNNTSLPKYLWIYSLRTTMYLLNRVPNKAALKTPSELWTSKKPSLRHLHVWGVWQKLKSIVYMKVNWILIQLVVILLVTQRSSKDLDFIVLIIMEKSEFIFYYPNYNLRIIETENAKFIENGEVSRRNESRNMIIEKILSDILFLTFPLRTFIIVQ